MSVRDWSHKTVSGNGSQWLLFIIYIFTLFYILVRRLPKHIPTTSRHIRDVSVFHVTTYVRIGIGEIA